MNLRSTLKRLINMLGYDIRRQVKDSSPIFDLNVSNIQKVSLGNVSAKFFIGDKLDTVQASHEAGTFFEADMLQAIAKRFSDGQCFVDIGANVGNHTIYMAKRFPHACLIAFEPMRLQHALLTINTLLNGIDPRTKIHKLAASDRMTMSRMITPFSGNLGRSMIADVDYGEWVALVPADDVLKDENVHFIKIDVEGHELQALEGLDKTIHRCRPTLLVEVNECNRKIFTNWLNTKDYQVDAEFKHNQENYEVLILPSERL